MDQIRRGWSRDEITELEETVGWWFCELEGWDGFRVKVTEDGEETLFRCCDNQNELEMVDLLQHATSVLLKCSSETLGVQLGDQAGSMARFAKVMRTAKNPVPCLEDLTIMNSPTHFETRSVLEAIASNKLPRLTSLRLSEVDPEHFRILEAAAESGCLSDLKRIYLDRPRCSVHYREPLTKAIGTSVFPLASAIESGQMPALEELNLWLGDIGDAGCEAYAAAFSAEKLPSLAVISFNSCGFGDEGAKALGRAIMRLGGLKHLALRGNLIGDDGFSVILDSFQVASEGVVSNLQFLDLSGNSYFSIVAGLSLAKAISSHRLVSLKHLDLSANKISAEGLTVLADSFHDGGNSLLPNLQSLHLSDNRFTEVGFRSLTKAISSGCLNSLQSLDVRSCVISDQGLIKFSAAFQGDGYSVLPNLRRLSLSDNPFTALGILALGMVFAHGFLKSLEALDVSSSLPKPISQEGSRAFVTALSNHKNLEQVQAGLHHSSEKVLQKILGHNSRMRAIMKGLQGSPVVPAAFSKVYICGDPEVGKTTLRKTLQRGLLKSWVSWERRPHVEQRTRGIDVSLVAGNRNKLGEDRMTLLVWDMAGQNEYHLLHNALFLDLSSADGKATSFIIVCDSKTNLQDSKQQLVYWLQFIASSCGNITGNLRHVLVVVNNIGGDPKVMDVEENWKEFITHQRDVFKDFLDIHIDPFILDVRKYKSAKDLKRNLLDHASDSLRGETVPKICQFLQRNLYRWSEARQKFPVLEWNQFVKEVHEQSKEPWPEQKLEAATRYLNEAGLLVYIDVPSELVTPPRRLVVLNPNWFCKEIAGKMFLHQDMLNHKERHFRERVDPQGSVSISEFKEFFDYSSGKWNNLDFKDLISILLWLGLCYQGRDDRLYIPALIPENQKPVWTYDYGEHQWVMGLIIQHKKSATTLAPIALWHRFQVELAQASRFNGSTDNAFHNGRYFVNFCVDHMYVLIEVIVDQGSPTFDEIGIFVKPLWRTDDPDGEETKQRQVDLAKELVEILLTTVWDKVCPGVEYLERVVWPWPANQTRPKVPRTSLEVAEIQKWVEKHGVKKNMQRLVGSDTVRGDQLLSTKHKEEMGILKRRTEEVPEAGIIRPEVPYRASTWEWLTEWMLDTLHMRGVHDTVARQTLRKLDELMKGLHIVRDLGEANLKVSNENKGLLTEHRDVLHKLQNKVEFFTQDQQRKCPILVYVEERNSWLNKVLPWRRYCLRFACEAKFKDGSYHEVNGQQGLDMSHLKDWARTVGAPWLKVSLTVLLLSANIAANAVLPGIGLVISSFGQTYQSWSAIAGGVASAGGLSRDQIAQVIAKMDLDVTNAGEHPQELYGKSMEAISKVVDDLTPTAFKEKVGLRKVCLSHDQRSLQKIVWICDDCYEKYRDDRTPMKEL